MGLFDFTKDIGKKLFGGDDDPAEKIEEHIRNANIGIDPLSVIYNDGKALLTGQAPSREAFEKAVLLAGNIKGVTEVNGDGLKTPESEQKVEYYVIKSGDSLSKIAKEYYGNAMDYPKIFEANKEVIEDPDLIYPGQKIRIPL